MPITVIDVDGGRGNLIVGSGFVTSDEYVEAMRHHLQGDPARFAGYLFSLSDYSRVTRVEVDSDAVRRVAQWSRDATKKNQHSVVAVSAPQDLIYGLSRMWDLSLGESRWDTQIFRSRESAEAWIRERVEEEFGVTALRFV
jgi:hypothetical protein